MRGRGNEERGREDSLVELEGMEEQEGEWAKIVSKENISMMTLNNIIHQEEGTEEEGNSVMMMITTIDHSEEDLMIMKEVEGIEGVDIEEEEGQ